MKLTSEHKLLCDAAAMRAHLDKYSRIEQRALLTRVIEHLNTVVAGQAPNEIEDYFMRALRLQALVHTGKYLCHNCNDPIDDDHETFCGMCRAMTPKKINDAYMKAWDEFGDNKSTEFLVQITAERCKVDPSVVYDALAFTHSHPEQEK